MTAAVEVLTTLALRPGMHVVDRADRTGAEHVVAAVPVLAEPGSWDVAYADGRHALVGARHAWSVVAP